MARAPSKRVKLNVAALNELELAVADGLSVIAERILENAEPRIPDDPGTSSSIAKTGGWVVLNGSRKVGGPASKPKSLDTRRKHIIVAAAGYGSPLAHLHERGTVGRVQEETGRFTGALPARPFLLPAVTSAVQELGAEVGRAIEQHGLSKP